MSTKKSTMNMKVKRVDDVLVAGARFRGEFEEIPARFGKLSEQAGNLVNGPAILLYEGRHPEGGFLLGACYPVSEPVETDEITSWTLGGVEMLTAAYTGPHDSPSAILGEIFAYIRENDVSIASAPPLRWIYKEKGDEHKKVTEETTSEIQVPLMIPVWLGRLAEGLVHFSGESAQESVMAGADSLTGISDPSDVAKWIKDAMARLDRVVTDETIRSKVMVTCSHRYPEWRLEEMRAKYEELESIDELLVIMRLDKSDGGRSWYGHQERIGNVLYETKLPYDSEKYAQASNRTERRAAYCHCGLVRAAILGGWETEISVTHCYCGAGWYHQLWEGILGMPVRVEIRRSLLKGDDCCSLAIHLPLDDLPA